MASFADQLEAARVAHLAASRQEAAARALIASIFDRWDSGELTAQSVRWELERVVRDSYRTSAAVAAAHTSQQSEIDGWFPQGAVFNNDYLQSLIADVRRNLRDFKRSDRDASDRRRAILRMQHSVGVAAQRGYTDSMIESYAELEDFGYRLRKVWRANFVNNTPCPICRSLHNTEVDLRGEFRYRTSDKAKVYINLQGPPRHPQCQCWLAILIVGLENAWESIDLDDPEDDVPTSVSTDDVKKLPWTVFKAILAALRKVGAKLIGR